MNYHRYDHDKLEAADNMKIERSIYFNESDADISTLTALPLGELAALREQSAAEEQAIFERLQAQAAAWEEQAGKTLLLDKAIEYARTPEAQHTSNEWTQPDEYRHVRSNRVYRMQYSISENTRYDQSAGKSVPYSYTLSWGIYTNSPGQSYGTKIAGQSKKVFATKADMEKYLNGRIKAYQHLFTEVSPPIPQEYAKHFKVNGQLLPGYTVEGEQPPQQAQPPQEPKQETPVFDTLTPEKQQELSDTVQATLQTLIGADIAAHGEVTAGTLEAIQAQGYSYRDGQLEKAPQQEQPEQEAGQPDAPAPEPRPVVPIVLTSEKPAEKLKEITDRLEQGITELFDSEKYKEYLQVMSRFHNYSLRNTILIAMQKPDASLIAGFSAWKNNFQRSVMKGEKGIKIIAPSPFKVKQEMKKIDPRTQQPVIGRDGKPVMEEKEVTIPAYKVVTVFDVSQTEGRELPTIGVNELTGNMERFKEIFAALEKISPVPVGFEKIEGGAHGYYHLEDKRIAIDEGMSELQTLKTLIHEIAHAKLHDIDLKTPQNKQQPRADRRTREVEAESVAYTVCQRYGLDTSDYSFGYVAGWSSGKELTELKGSLETIRSAAAEIIDGIDAILAEAQKDREQGAAQEQPAPQEKAAAPEYIYKVRKNPDSDRRENSYLLQAYIPQENGRAKLGDVLYVGTPEKCHALMGQLVSGELTQGQVKELYAKAQELPPDSLETGETIRTPRGTFYVTDMTCEQMEAAGYGFHHQSDDGKYFIMTNGTRAFAIAAEPPQRDNPLQAAELSTEQNANMIDGVINNTPPTPTVDALEARAKAGEHISLVDLANAIKADRERGGDKPAEKPSIRAQLRAAKEQQAARKKTAAKSKQHEMEV